MTWSTDSDGTVGMERDAAGRGKAGLPQDGAARETLLDIFFNRIEMQITVVK